MISMYRPRIKFGAVRVVRGRFKYIENVDVGLGVVQVDFVDSVPAPTEIFYGNLISPAPLLRVGLDEYDSFLRWRKTWQRVTSVVADWTYDDSARSLYIHNPVERYHCGIVCHFPWEKTESLDLTSSTWLKKWATAKCNLIYGGIMRKFSGAIPGPIRDLTLDQNKRSEAASEVEKLESQLFALQDSAAIQID
jgi:hypothetical protein